jgi:hypothetical protein
VFCDVAIPSRHQLLERDFIDLLLLHPGKTINLIRGAWQEAETG